MVKILAHTRLGESRAASAQQSYSHTRPRDLETILTPAQVTAQPTALFANDALELSLEGRLLTIMADTTPDQADRSVTCGNGMQSDVLEAYIVDVHEHPCLFPPTSSATGRNLTRPAALSMLRHPLDRRAMSPLVPMADPLTGMQMAHSSTVLRRALVCCLPRQYTACLQHMMVALKLKRR